MAGSLILSGITSDSLHSSNNITDVMTDVHLPVSDDDDDDDDDDDQQRNACANHTTNDQRL